MRAEAPAARLWDLDALAAPPAARTIEAPEAATAADTGGGRIEGIVFAAEPYRGRTSEVFAYLGIPAGRGPFPAMVCLHAGGGRAFREWVARWTGRGYAAIAPDLDARGPGGRPLDRGGPPQAAAAEFAAGIDDRERWSYHAIAAALRARALLAARPEVDASRIGIVGVSWGGALAAAAAGLESRFSAGVSIYGSGFLQSASGRERRRLFDGLTAAERRRWRRLFDPARHLPRCRAPFLFASGARDGGFPLDLLRRTAALPRGPVFLAVRPEMEHGHAAAWRCREVDRFADHALRGAPPPPRLGAIARDTDRGRVAAPFVAATPPARAALHVTRDRGEWKLRAWESSAAALDLATARAEARLPAGATACFFTVEDADGCLASSPHLTLADLAPAAR